jgi:hypothetical protein
MNDSMVNFAKSTQSHILSSILLRTPGSTSETVTDAPEAADRLMEFHFQKRSPLQTLGTLRRRHVGFLIR